MPYGGAAPIGLHLRLWSPKKKPWKYLFDLVSDYCEREAPCGFMSMKVTSSRKEETA